MTIPRHNAAPAPRLSMACTQRQEFSTEQVLEYQGTEWRAIIVGTVASAVQSRIRTVLESKHYADLSRSSHGVDHLALRLTKEAVFLAGQSMMEIALRDAPSKPAAEVVWHLQRCAAEAAEDIVNAWSSNPHVYVPLEHSIGMKSYREDLRAPAPDGDAPAMDHVPALQADAETRFPSAVNGSYHALRQATFREGTVDDVPRIVASYRSALLTSDVLALLERQPGDYQERIVERIAQFRARMHKGVFVWDLDEREMTDDLNGKSVDEKGLEFRIRLLEGADGELLSWMTYLHNPVSAPSGQRRRIRKTMKDYLTAGVTGKMAYDDSTPAKLFAEDAERSQLFLDIRSHHPGGAKRLGALAYQEMLRDNHHLNHVFAYRLYDIHVDPELGLGLQTRERGILPAINDSSGDLFRSWGYRHVAFDRNMRDGDHWAKREDVAGRDRRLNLKWDVMAGRLEDVEKSATKLWQREQRGHGDTSHDFISPVAGSMTLRRPST